MRSYIHPRFEIRAPFHPRIADSRIHDTLMAPLHSTRAPFSAFIPSSSSIDLSLSLSSHAITPPMASPNPTQDHEPDSDGDQKEFVGKRWPSVVSIGKKAAIAGAALASAPVVVPPLLLFSALGLAFALPFGVLFAGVFCADKVMQALLLPDSQEPIQEEEEGEDEDEEERRGGGEGSESIGEREPSDLSTSIYESAVEDQVSDGESKGAKTVDDEVKSTDFLY